MNAPSRQGDKIKRQVTRYFRHINIYLGSFLDSYSSIFLLQIRIVQQKALEDDPTVYQYDELYDDIEKEKQEKQSVKKEDKKPKYIEKLLTAADKRKKENERRVERQV